VTPDPGGIKMFTGREVKKRRLWRSRHATLRAELEAFDGAFAIIIRKL